LGDTGITRLRELARREGRSLFGAAADIDRIPRVAAKAKQALAEFRSLIEGLRQELEGASVSRLLEHTIKTTAYEGYLREHFDDADERLANLGELLDAAADYDAGPSPDGLRGFLEEATLASDQDALDARSDTVKLMTLHAAKGLEFDHVFVAGVEEGLLPLVGEAEKAEELEEERRLLYVGITRARKSATLTFAHFRRQYGLEEARIPSRFLEELPQEHLHTLEFGEEGRRPARSRALASMHGRGGGRVPSRGGWAPEGPLPGEWVEHPSLGRGQVLALEPSEEGDRATVRFVDGSTRVLVLKYANLTRLGRKR
jgi:DNA helicase-2/ATP-dependent DNA helicase PcrA